MCMISMTPMQPAAEGRTGQLLTSLCLHTLHPEKQLWQKHHVSCMFAVYRMTGSTDCPDSLAYGDGTLVSSREQPLEGIVGQNRPAQHRQAHEGAVTAVVPTPDGLYCLTAGTDSRIRLWDLSDNR